MIEAVIFDLDGVLIDSEPLWKKAEQKVFKTVGINLTDKMCRNTTGLDNLSTVKYWYAHKAWKKKSINQVATEITDEVLMLLQSHEFVNEDVDRIINYFEEKNIPMAIASSSEMKIILAVLEKLKLRDKFAAVHSSEFEEFGKPHPSVYLSASKMLSTAPERCLVFEDSFNGAIAAKSARMKVVLVPDNEDYKNTRFDFVDLKIKSIGEFNEDDFEALNNKI